MADAEEYEPTIVHLPGHVDYGSDELNAMSQCYRAVEQLDHAARFRVVDWLADRLRSEQGEVPANGERIGLDE